MSKPKSITDLTALSFQGQSVRSFVDAKGMLQSIVVDVGRILDLDNIRQALTRVRERDKGVIIADTPGGPQRLVTVNEPGLYRLIMLSRKPEAEAFQDWLFEEVLPTLRRTGRYAMPGSAPQTTCRSTWADLRQRTLTQVKVFTYALDAPERWVTTRDIRAHAGIHEVTAREYAAYFSRLGAWEKLHQHPCNLYRLHPESWTHAPALLRQMQHARSLPACAFPLLPTPNWESSTPARGLLA